MSKRLNKKKNNRPVPVAPQDDYQDFEGEDLNDVSHFGPYEEYEFVDPANSELNTKFENHFIDEHIGEGTGTINADRLQDNTARMY